MNSVVIAIIGAEGQLGSEITKLCKSHKNYKTFPYSKSELNCKELEQLKSELSRIKPDIVINCAAFVKVDECEIKPNLAFDINSVGSLNISLVCKEIDACCIYISTDYIFDGRKNTPYNESDNANPLNVYGFSKMCGEYFVQKYCNKHFVIRTSGLYGNKNSSKVNGNFINAICERAINKLEIKVVNDQIFSPTYSTDLAKSILDLANTKKYGTYHITNTGECSWYEFSKEVFRILKINSHICPVSTLEYGSLAIRPYYSVLSNRKLINVGINDLRTWEESLYYYLKQEFR